MRTILFCLCFLGPYVYGPGDVAGQESLMIKTIKGASGIIYSIAVSSDGKYVAAGGVDKNLNIWRVEDSSRVRSLKGHASFINSVAFSPAGDKLASASEDGIVKIWSLEKSSCLNTLKGHQNAVSSVAFFPDGKSVASGSGDGTVKLWRTGSKTPYKTLKGRSGYIYAVAVSTDGKRIAAGNANGTITVWDHKSGRLEITLEGHRGAVNSVSFPGEGNYLASGGEDGTVKIWRLSDGLCVKTFTAQQRSVLAVAYSPDGKYVFSGGRDNAVSAWPVSDNGQPRTFLGHSGPVKSVVFTPDGKYMMSGSLDKTIKLWLTPWEAERRDQEIKKAAETEAEKNSNYETHYAAGVQLLAAPSIENAKGAIIEFTRALSYKQDKNGEAKLAGANEVLRLAEYKKKRKMILSVGGLLVFFLLLAVGRAVSGIKRKIRLKKSLPGEIKSETLSGSYEKAFGLYEEYKAAGGDPKQLSLETLFELFRGTQALEVLPRENIPYAYLLAYAAAIAKEGNHKLALSMLRSGKLADDFKEPGDYDAFAEIFEKTNRPENLLMIKLTPAAYSGLAEAFFKIKNYAVCEKVCALKKQFHAAKITPRDNELLAACQKARG